MAKEMSIEEAKEQGLTSMDISEEKREQFKRLFPEVFTEDKVDFDQLRRVLGDFVDADKERFGLNWPGKANCMKIIQQPSVATLKPARDESVDFDATENLFIEGDNLEVLKLLQKAYFGKVKMIYIDPPYNTGKEFIYPDKYAENLDTYLEYTGQKDAEGRKFATNTDTVGRYHSNWLNMMYPRLYLAKNLLREDGVIFISIDDNEMTNLKALCDQLFGEENHIATLTIINNMKGRNDKKNIATCHEYLIAYSRGGYESYGVPLSEDQLAQYKFEDDKNEKYALRDLRKRGRPDRREDRPNMYFPIFYNEKLKTCSLERQADDDVEITPKRGDGSDGRWRWGKERVSANLGILHPKYSTAKNRWDVEHRVYLNPNATPSNNDTDEEADDDDKDFERTSKPKSFWWGGEISTDVANREFKNLFDGINPSYPKSPYYLEKLLHMGTKKNDIVLDFFAGYSTTAQSVYSLNSSSLEDRKFIMVQLPEICSEDSEEYKGGYKTIAELSKERIRRAAKKIAEENPDYKGDMGFKVFKLAQSNFNIWEGNAEEIDDLTKQLEMAVDHIKDASTPEDILYELLLKAGFPLTTKVEKVTMAEKEVFSVEDSAMLICLEKKLTQNVLDAMADAEPFRVVCLDEGFKGNDELKANAVQTFKSRARDKESAITFTTV